MATGESQTSLDFSFRVSQSYISRIIRQVFASIRKCMGELLPAPTTEQLLDSANVFGLKWNFPNAVGAIDGKHVCVQCPAGSESLYFNYKGFFSVVLLAIVDANYKFLCVDIGSYGREGDAGI